MEWTVTQTVLHDGARDVAVHTFSVREENILDCYTEDFTWLRSGRAPIIYCEISEQNVEKCFWKITAYPGIELE